MSDGVRLSADLYCPLAFDLDSDSSLPVVMEYIPYRKDDLTTGSGSPFGERSWYRALPLANYILARVDCRGTGASEGSAHDEYSPEEQRDGYEAVEWLARQQWCNGRVAMIGISYGGFTALQVAASAPPHLVAIVPVDFTDNRYTDDCHYVGGLLRMYHDTGYYGTFMVAFNAMPPDPGASGAEWSRIWQQHLEENTPYMLQWLRHQKPGDYWLSGSVGPVANEIRCAVFMIGGWHDGYVNPPLRLWPELNVPKRLLIGPWDHDVPDTGIPGPRIDYMPEVVGWLDQWCVPGAPEHEHHPLAIFVEHYSPPDADMREATGHWRTDADWPPADLQQTTFYLGPATLDARPEPRDSVDLNDYDPSVGVCTGLFSAGIPMNLPTDQRRDEAFSLVYTSPILESDIEIIGRPRVVIWSASTAETSAVSAVLSEVGTSGQSRFVTKGITRCAPPTSPRVAGAGGDPESVELNTVAWRFSKGNRLRLSVANGDFPNVWPTPDPARFRLFRGGATPSRLELPVVPIGEPAAPSVVFPPAPRVTTPEDRSAYREWRIIDDPLLKCTEVQCAFVLAGPSVSQDPFTFSAVVSRVRPADASMKGTFTKTKHVLGREIAATAHTVISSTSDSYHITISLTVTIDGQPYFSRGWSDSVPREA